MTDDIPDTGAVFTFGKSRFADNEPSHFFIKNDPIVAISCGDEHSAVICQNGRVFVFGSNSWGQLGLGHNEEVTRPSCVKWLKPQRAIFVACGRAHTVFVTDSNAIYTVGCNDEGQLGTGDMEHQSVPQYVELDDNTSIKQVSAGSNHTAILTEEGRVFVCGSNSDGQLGLGEDTKNSLRFTELKFVEKIAFVECGYYHTVFITSKGAVFVTGDNENNKLGIPNTASAVYVPEVLPLPTPIKSACCGASHTFLLTMDESKILTVGSNDKGQLGLPKDLDRVTSPTEIDIDKMFDGFQLKLIACGAMHTAFVTDNGLLYTCGESRHNKLCLEEVNDAENLNDATANQYTPKRVTAMNGYIVDNVACGGCHTLLTATKGSNADFTNNDFNIISTENRQIVLNELPPLQKIMNKPEEYTGEDVTNSNTQLYLDNVNGNIEETGSINSLEANVSGSHIVNINDLENDNGSTDNVLDVQSDELNKPQQNNTDKGIESVTKNLESTYHDDITKMGEAMNYIDKTAVNINEGVGKFSSELQNTTTNITKDIEDMTLKIDKRIETIGQDIKNTAVGVKDSLESKSGEAKNKVSEKVESVDHFKKTIKSSPGRHDEKGVLEVPDKSSEITNSPPPKSPILQDLLQVPDLTHLTTNLNKYCDEDQKTGQSDSETILCDSDKSSPQAGKTKMQAVMPIVRSEDTIESHGEGNADEGSEVVVNKLQEKGRFARIFQSLKDKEASCMTKGKVIEEHAVENIHKGIEGAEETVHKVEERVETEIRNQTNSRTCHIL